MIDKYFEEKKRNNLILTNNNFYGNGDYSCMKKTPAIKRIDEPTPVSHWSKSNGRYRTKEEQEAYIASGMVDKILD